MSKVSGFDASNFRYYALRQNGELVSWWPYDFPEEEAGLLAMPTDMGKVKQVLCMPNTVFAIDSANTVRGWGKAENGLLDIPAGLTAKKLYTSNRRCIGAIKMDGSVSIWGSLVTFEGGGNLSTLIPAGLKAKFLAIYDEYALAINMAGAVVSWGKLPEGFVIPAGLEPVSTVCSTGNTSIALKDTEYLASWKTPAFPGVPVFSPEYNFSRVKAIDSNGNCYALLDNLNKLVTWTFNSVGGIVKLYSNVSNVSSFKIVRENGSGSKPRICIIHKSGLVSILSPKPVDRRVPSSLAHFSSQSSADLVATGPGAPIAAAAVPLVIEGDERQEDGASTANTIPYMLNVVNPQPEIKPVIVKSVSLGSNHGACLTEDGKIVCWGDYKPEEVVAEIGVKDVVCGSNSIHYINSQNNVVVHSAGSGKRVIDEKVSLIYTSVDDDSILVKISDHGINSYNETQLKPVGVPFQYGYSKVQKLPFYTVALTKNNKVKLYARSVDVDNVPSPNQEDISGKKFTDFAGGTKVCLIVDTDGLVYGWKSAGFRGESLLPDGLKKAKFVTGYLNRFAAIKPDNSVVVWSYDDEDNIVVDETLPKRLKAKYISLNAFGIAIVNILGKVNVVSNRSALKDIPLNIVGSGGDDAMRYLPALPENSPVLQLACGKGYTLCLRKDTTVVGWGLREGGILEIPPISAKYVCAGDGIAGAITMDDSFVGWGTGADGGRAFEPIDRKKMKKVILHKSGLGLTLAGEVIVFGLPESVRDRYTVPAGLTNVGNIEFLEYGEKRRYMALKSDMTVVVWGDDAVSVPGNAVRIAVGRAAFLVVRKNGVVDGYGSNANKELEVPGQLRAKDIYAGDACLAISATNSSFGSWGPSTEDTEAYQGSTNWFNRGFAFGNMNKKVAYLAYSGYHYGAVNLDGQVILWGNNDNSECSVPSMLKNSMNPFNMNGTISSVALNWDYGVAVVDGSIKVWGGLTDSLENRLANLSDYSGNDVKQVLSAGKMWFGLIRGGNVIYWNAANGAVSGVETNLLSISNHGDYDKLACSKSIIVGLVKGSGKVRAYGKRGYGIQKIPASIKDGGIKDVFAGPTCAMAINANDELVVWGEKRNTCLNIPADLGKVKTVVFGDTFAVAIKLDGDLYMWGGLSSVALEAARLGLPKGKFKAISSEGQNKYVGIREDDSVVEWGGEHFIQEYVMPFGLKGAQVYTSGVSGFSVAVDLNGELVIWGGSKGGGQNDPLDNVVSASDLTVGEPVKKKYVAKKNVSVRTEIISDDTVSFISAGTKQVGIIDAGGNVKTWGPNANNEHFIPRHMTGCDLLCVGPTYCVARNSLGQYFIWGKWAAGSGLNEFPEDLDCKKMVLTDYTGLAINEDDKLVKWGRMPGLREDADETNLPEGLIKARDIAGINSNFIAADMDGQIYLWGKGDPIKYDPTKKAIAVVAGLRHYAAILEDNSVISWGNSNEYGQSNVPVGLKAKKIASFYHFTVAIDMDDNLVGWGYPSACSTVPTGLKAVDIACGGLYAIALLTDGKYVIWGHNINNNVSLAPTEAFLDPSLTLAEVARYDFRKDFDVATKYQLNRKQFKELAREDKVFDMVLHKAGRNLVDFLMEHQGNAVIFRYKGEQTATLKSAIEAGFREKGDSYRVNVFYECTGRHVMEDAQLGTFDFQDIYRKPYYQLNLANGTFLITMDDLERIFKSNQFWILQDTGIKLDYTASYWSVVAGGPLISANHCQEGSDKMVYMLVPFSFISEEEDEEELVVPQDKVKVKLGEEVTEVDITESKRVLDVKTKFALVKGVAVERLKFIAGGKILKDDDLVVPGIVIQVILGSAGGNLRVERVNKTRKI